MTPRVRLVVGALLVGAIGLVTLFSTAVHANTSADGLVSAQQTREADYSNAYYDCLTAQAHRLVGPHDVVFLAVHDLNDVVIITKAVGGWTRMTEHVGQATVALVLQDEPARHRQGTCHGQALVSIRRTSSGRAVMVRASGSRS